MWRFAVLYSLAKSIGRFPGISNTSTWTCDKLNGPREIEKTFPVFYAVQYFFVSNSTKFKYIQTTIVCKHWGSLYIDAPKRIYTITGSFTVFNCLINKRAYY